ncbi:hypothetical protein [Oceanobacillus jeddahense]|nr:hypothetical protein [Oceanobacillus jeddahense]
MKIDFFQKDILTIDDALEELMTEADRYGYRQVFYHGEPSVKLLPQNKA